MNEPLGIVEERRAVAAKYARFAYVAPQDRIVSKPAVAVASSERYAASARLAELRQQIAAREKELAAFDVQIAAKKHQLAGLIRRVTLKRGPQILEVQEAFVRLVRESGYEIEGRPYTFNDLVCRSNQDPHVPPRHVCMDLARQLTMETLADIARGFGYTDHTSVKHALGRAAAHMEKLPMLADVHAKILAQFGPK